MDTPECGPAEISALEQKLEGLRPVVGHLNRDRILYEAGRVAARTEARRSLLVATSVALSLALIGSGCLLMRERARSHRLEMQLAAHQPEQTSAATNVLQLELNTPAEISPNSYLALSKHIRPGGLDEPRPVVDAGPERPFSDSPQFAPFRVRDTPRALDL
jgi:hypothetical protein